MKISYLTLFPQLIESYISEALLKKAIDHQILDLEVINLRDFSDNKYKSVDDSPFGGGDGMILRPEIAEAAFKSVMSYSNKTLKVYLSPQGQVLDQKILKDILNYDHIILLCGRYGGVDQRILNQHIDQEISIGDYVLSGGELAALVLTEALSRFLPGVLGHAESVQNDSLSPELNGLLEAPQFTKPQDFVEQKIPSVLVSGDHSKIKDWRNHLSLLMTWKKRKDLFLKFKDQFRSQCEDQLFLKAHKKFIAEISSADLKIMGLSESDANQYLLEWSKPT